MSDCVVGSLDPEIHSNNIPRAKQRGRAVTEWDRDAQEAAVDPLVLVLFDVVWRGIP